MTTDGQSTDRDEPTNGNDDGTTRRDRVAAAGIFALALALRLLHLRQIAIHDPFYAQPGVDGAIYDEWARAMLAGEGLGDGVLFLGPLYPAFMAAVYAVFGPSLAALKTVQAVIGAATCVLVHGLARELFDRRVALVAGGLAALYGMHIFYGGTVMIVNLQVPLVVGLVWAILRALDRPDFVRWAFCGVLLGLSALARQTVLLMAPVIALWVLFGMRGEHGFVRRLAWGSTFGAVIVLVILPFTIHNYVVGDDLVLLNSTGGANFYMGNRRGADGTWQLPPLGRGVRVDNPRVMREAFTTMAEEAEGRPLRPSEVSSYWLGRGVAEIREDPVRWLGLMLRKAGLFVNAYEVWNNRSIDISRDFSWVLRLPLVGFGLVAPLGLLGLALTRRRWRELLPLHAALGAYLASALLFFVLSRYRMPAAMLFVPLAAAAIVDLADRIREQDGRALAGRAVALAALVALVHWPLASEQRMQMAYYNLGNKYRSLGRFDEAIGAYRSSLEANPRAISTHNNLAVALELGGYDEQAIAAWRVVRQLAFRSGDRLRIERAERHLRDLGAREGGKKAPAPVPAPVETRKTAEE